MPNINGLTSIAPVFNTGSEDSGFWAKKDRPEFVGGFITIVSPDGGAYGTIEESDGGDLTLSTADATYGDIILENTGNIYLKPGSSLESIVPPARAVYIGLTQGDSTLVVKNDNAGTPNGKCHIVLEDTSSNGKKFEVASTAGSVYITDVTDTQSVMTSNGVTMTLLTTSATPTITTGTGGGQLYDSVYNKPPGFQAITSINSYSGAPANIVLNSLNNSLTAGTYQLQMFAESVVAPIDTRLRLYATLSSGGSVINYSSASTFAGGEPYPVPDPPVTTLSISEISLNSGYFNVPSAANYNFYITSSGGNWTATEWGVQLVKIA